MLYDYRGMRATGRTGDRFVELVGEDLIKLPKGASLVMLPGGAPVGISRAGRFSLLESNPWVEGRTWAAGALLPQGYTRTLLPSFIRVEKDRPLPLLGYAAVADRGGELYVAARRTGDPYQWDPVHYNTKKLPALIKEGLGRFPQNRILNHLARCSMDYQCFTAQNIFYNR
ncbi:MAG: radical SAM protein, partial [Desulfotomaculaceae bacterium]|nr:radical SAM protein [Desulfotomaculaceae bacterium]